MFAKDSQGREHAEESHRYRSPFQRDRDRILHCAAYRRLSGKMQVFTGEMGDYHRTRLTHTQEVASIARTIGRLLRLNEDLIEGLALVHDIGHPPFGHCGEDALTECLVADGGFSHNQFALDLVQDIEQRYTSYRGLNLTLEVLGGQTFRSAKATTRAPLLEAQVVDAADSMAYDAHDLDDSLKLGLIDWQQIQSLAIIQRARRQMGPTTLNGDAQRKLLVYNLIDLQVDAFLDDSMDRLGEFDGLDAAAIRDVGLRLQLPSGLEAEKAELEAFLFENVYRHEKLTDIRRRAATRLQQLFRLLTRYPERLPQRFVERVASRGLHRTVGHYLAGMTDRFCDDQYVRMVELGRDRADDWE
jgi:dGTPase